MLDIAEKLHLVIYPAFTATYFVYALFVHGKYDEFMATLQVC
jgi:hypothetical protein